MIEEKDVRQTKAYPPAAICYPRPEPRASDETRPPIALRAPRAGALLARGRSSAGPGVSSIRGRARSRRAGPTAPHGTIMWLVSERRARAGGDGTGSGGDGDTERQRAARRASAGRSAGTVEFKSVACAGGPGSAEPAAPPLAALPDPQQFNIFPAFFSRQLNFSSGGACGQGAKIMEELRPNLVGGLLGVPGLLDDHQTDAKFLPSAVGAAVAEAKYAPDKGRKCSNASSSSAEEFSALYGGEHAHTPPAPPLPRALNDQPGRIFPQSFCFKLALRPSVLAALRAANDRCHHRSTNGQDQRLILLKPRGVRRDSDRVCKAKKNLLVLALYQVAAQRATVSLFIA
ncbi:hypothetical protein EVAR_21797_1 [Eumeta japonica]|uniref:Uncharacterized protein n=1 Tax=Eumeta variegata TaxID=151549 RepID=A0A4C1YJ78_EUMVA|nr:hypothetical protein EVAR_21797_1 [Eumeta japonica]